MNHFHTWPFGTGVFDSWLFIILKFVFIGLVLGLIIWILKLFLGDINENKKEDPLDVLKLRLVKGEISLDEFDKLKKKILEEGK